MKKLMINGEIYARYELEGNHIFIKCLKPEIFEDILIGLICKIEEVEIGMASFLNVDLETGK